MPHLADETSIDAILARVRAETAKDIKAVVSEPGRRKGLSTIPLVPVPEAADAVPPGRPRYTIEQFAALDDEDFLRNAYRVILGREIDGVGLGTRLPALRNGQTTVVRILFSLTRSAEGRARGIKIRGLLPAAILDRASSLPVVGRIVEPFQRLIVRSAIQQRLATLSVRQGETIDGVNHALTAIRKNQLALDQRIALSEQAAEATRLRAEEVADISRNALSEIRATRNEIANQRAAMSQLIASARDFLPAPIQSQIDEIEDASLDALYVAFENRFRGSTDEIARRQERYLPIFRATPPVVAGGTVLDIGCGRGEFLSLLKKHNFVPKGLDLNAAMVAEARARGHDVVEGDAIAWLEAHPEASLAAITGFHIVEHLPFKSLVRLMDSARRALMPGGIILFETPNPENLVVGACTFHYDPTHIRPLPPDYLGFIAEARGFAETRVIRKDEDCDLDQPESGFAPTEINDWFRQPPDYAVYARKPLENEAI
ncbi:methyltransferase domain-containing protein [Devosia sp. FJ2-5-3]|uniref:methyltransferase domain-containing protein n=1 Tax=Devosia sp. FJ2-5-3 TaxID=2976680 RepID=UPI0023D824F5|nr:methyltransferase domain-containing protein [Devosia sp. FJ2-5-3]WEJ58126.1 methyltransferase domain-containing protein [Devosia sp. FJ2-5-3]